MKTIPDIEHMHKLWKELSRNNALIDVWDSATEKLVKKYDIDCTLFYKDQVVKGYATELELDRLAQRLNVRQEKLLDFLTEEYHKIFFAMADEVLAPEGNQ